MEYNEQLYANKFDNSDEMANSLKETNCTKPDTKRFRIE